MNPYLLLGVLCLGFGVMALFLRWQMEKVAGKGRGDDLVVEMLKGLLRSTDERLRGNQEAVNSLSQSMAKILQQNTQNTTSVLQKNTQDLNLRLDKTAENISRVAREVGQMSEIGRSMKELQEFLKSPKLRGNIGEEVLKDLVGQMFSKNSFNLQYSFRSGEKVDVAIKTGAGILPIDSKFPAENFQKMMKAEDPKDKELARRAFVNDVRAHIRTIARKYILPEEGTVDFALMYVPSESVYYELVNQPEVLDFARRLRIYPVSPSTMYAALQTILLSFEGQKIEERSKEIFQLLRAAKKDFGKLDEDLGVLGKHVGNAYSKLGDVGQSSNRLGQKLSSAGRLTEIKNKELKRGK